MARFKIGPITDDGPTPGAQTEMTDVRAERRDQWVVKLSISDQAALFLSVDEIQRLAAVALGPIKGGQIRL